MSSLFAKENSNIKIFNDGTKIISNQGDFIYRDENTGQPGGVILSKEVKCWDVVSAPVGSLLLSMGGYIAVYKDGKLDGEKDLPDYYIGGGAIDEESLYYFDGGDFNQMIQDDNGNVLLALYNGSKVVGFLGDTFPGEPADITEEIRKNQESDAFVYNGSYYWYSPSKGIMQKHSMAKPDICIGATTVDTNVDDEREYFQNCNVDSNGTYMIASEDLHSHLLLWNRIPGENGAKPDTIYKFAATEIINDAVLFEQNGTTGVIAGGGNSIFIWLDIKDALSGAKPTIYWRGKVGTAAISGIKSIAWDGTHLYLSSNEGTNVFNGIPEKRDVPVATIKDAKGRIQAVTCTSGENTGKSYMTLSTNENVAYIYDCSKIIDNGEVSDEAIMMIPGAKHGDGIQFNGVSDVQITQDGHVIVCDMGFARILVWNRIGDAISATAANDNVAFTLGLGSNNYTIDYGSYGMSDNIPNQSENTLYSPHYIDYDGAFLWVGDYKFAGGIKAFKGLLVMEKE